MEELAASPEGRAAVQQVWPEWQEKQHPEQPARAVDASEPVPPSSQTRWRLARIVRAAAARDAALADSLLQMPAEVMGGLFIEALCEAGLRHPDSVLRLFEQAPEQLVRLSPEAQQFLGAAVVRHCAVRERVLQLWSEFPEDQGSLYPGRALEPLILQGDVDAARVYAEWLPSSNYAKGLLVDLPPDPRVFSVRVVRAAAYVLERVWGRAQGDNDGQPASAAASWAVSTLTAFLPCAEGDPGFGEGLLRWLASENPNKHQPAMMALEHIALVEEQRARVLDRVRQDLNGSDTFDALFTIPAALRLAEAQGLAASLIPELTALIEALRHSAIRAACLARTVVPQDQARRLSELASRRLVGYSELDDIPRDALKQLLALAPDGWAASILRADGRRGPVSRLSSLLLLQSLPAAQRTPVLVQLRETASAAVLPAE